MFTDSNAFLNHLKLVRGESLNLKNESIYDEELKRIVAEKGESLYVTLDLFNPYDYKHIDKIIEANIDRLFGYLPEGTLDQISNKVAIGGMEIKNINAAIVKHPKSAVYAIVINYGFIIYFVKFMSYIFAAGDIDRVLWCSECPRDQLNTDTIIRYTDTISDNYLSTGIPYGPELLLEKATVDEISFFTDLSVQYAICHEIGHFLNGDCEREANFTSFSLVSETNVLIEDKDEGIETKADLTAFSLLKGFVADEDLALYGLYLFFIGLDWLYKKPMGGEHPSPIMRYNKIVETYYSIEKAEEMSRFLRAFTIRSSE